MFEDWELGNALATYGLISIVMCVGFFLGAWWSGRRD
jgi:hypothetical protein